MRLMQEQGCDVLLLIYSRFTYILTFVTVPKLVDYTQPLRMYISQELVRGTSRGL